jgi:mono/diheme cytochrome c family protein
MPGRKEVMRLRAAALLAGFLAATIPAVGCSRPEPPKQEAPPAPAASAAEEGKALFERKCSVCHGLDRITARAETKERWKELIRDMQGRRPDWISDAEADKILEHLSRHHGAR